MASTPHGNATEIREGGVGGEAVRDQLNRVLASPLFANSKRCAGLLRFIVERSLEGNVGHFKERSLGIDVFQRDADYDTNRDPVVRTTAVEIRKRLAQYYMTPDREGELRIALPAGSYAPEFRLPAVWSPQEAPSAPVSVFAPRRRSLPRSALAAVLVSAVVALWWIFPVPGSDFDRFWNPVVSAAGPVVLVIGGPAPADAAVEEPQPVTVRELQTRDLVAFADAGTLARLTGVLMMKGKAFHFRRHEAARLEDLRDGPVILIGAFNNDWSIRLGDQPRFRFAREPQTRIPYIEDRQNPASRKWRVDMDRPYKSLGEDFAVVSRFQDQTTGRLVVQAAGITKFGTSAAGEFLSDPAYLERALQSAPKGWDRKNLQILLSTKLVGESSGPPQVVASHFW